MNLNPMPAACPKLVIKIMLIVLSFQLPEMLLHGFYLHQIKLLCLQALNGDLQLMHHKLLVEHFLQSLSIPWAWEHILNFLNLRLCLTEKFLFLPVCKLLRSHIIGREIILHYLFEPWEKVLTISRLLLLKEFFRRFF